MGGGEGGMLRLGTINIKTNTFIPPSGLLTGGVLVLSVKGAVSLSRLVRRLLLFKVSIKGTSLRKTGFVQEARPLSHM